MLDFKENEDGFDIYYKAYNLISHKLSLPFLEIGIGKGKFNQRHSTFRIRDKLEKKLPLLEYEILSKLRDQIILEFNNEEFSIVVEFIQIEDKLLISLKTENESLNRLWIRLNAKKGEAVFGCGEQFNNLNLRGQIVPIWVEDASPVTRKNHTYYPQPNFISSDKYYCHIETSFYSKFDFSNENYHELHIWNIPEEIYFGKFDTMFETVKSLNKFLGLQPKLADWVYDGIWLGIQGGPEIINKKIKKAKKHDIEVTAIWCQDWQGIKLTSFGKQLFWNWKYDPKIYPNLPNYIKKLNSDGIRFLGYINTMLAIEGALYKEASSNGYCIKDKDEKDYLTTMTDFSAAQIDLTNDEAVDWLKQVIKENMIGIGLSGWMVDYGEYVPVDASLHSGISGEEFHNLNPTIWTRLNYDVIKDMNLLDEIIFFSRSGYTGTSKYSIIQFSGDQRVDWDKALGLPSVIPASINMGLCGIGYYNFDIGCYTTYLDYKREKELFMRSAENAVFSMIMRTHEGNKPDENWQFDSDEETLNHLSRMVKLHVHLKPYLKRLSEEYQDTGIPPIRGCFLHYEEDNQLYDMKFQFLLGKDLLIAPVIHQNEQSRKLYLPKDEWVHLWSGKKFNQGFISVEAPIGYPPVFFRSKSKYSDLFEQMNTI